MVLEITLGNSTTLSIAMSNKSLLIKVQTVQLTRGRDTELVYKVAIALFRPANQSATGPQAEISQSYIFSI